MNSSTSFIDQADSIKPMAVGIEVQTGDTSFGTSLASDEEVQHFQAGF
jgi:hypothetical protein